MLVVEISYLFITWLILYKLQIYSLNEEVTELVLPLILSIITIILFIRPKVRFLKFKKRESDKRNVILFICTFIMIGSLLNFQKYINSNLADKKKYFQEFQVLLSN